MTTVDEAWDGMDRDMSFSWQATIEHHRPIIEAAIRAEVRDGYAQGMMDGIIEGQRDAEAKLAALREAAIEEREATEDFIANGGQVQMERMDRSRVKLDDAIAATTAEDGEERT